MSNIKIISERTNSNYLEKGGSNFDIEKYPLLFQQPKRVKSPTAWVEHIPFAFFAIEVLKPKLLVELGVHTGNSYSAFCQATSILNTGTSCYGVDTWKGDEHAEFYDDSIFNELNEYNNNNYAGFSSLVRGTFDEALKYFSDKSIDLLHIDGFHTYEAVTHDFNTWLPKMSNRGIILLHDTCVRVNNFGVWKLFEELSSKYQTFEFIHGHGLGIIVIGDNVSKDFLAFLDAAKENDYYLSLFAKLGENIRRTYEFSLLEESARNLNNQVQTLNNDKSNLTAQINTLAQKAFALEKGSSSEAYEAGKNVLKTQIQSLENSLAETELRQAHMDNLYDRHRQDLEKIKGSKSWKVAKTLSRIVGCFKK